MFGCPKGLAMVEASENTCVGEVDVLPHDSARPEEDVGFIVGSGKQGINIGRAIRHEEREQSFDELEHCRWQVQVLDARTDSRPRGGSV